MQPESGDTSRTTIWLYSLFFENIILMPKKKIFEIEATMVDTKQHKPHSAVAGTVSKMCFQWANGTVWQISWDQFSPLLLPLILLPERWTVCLCGDSDVKVTNTALFLHISGKNTGQQGRKQDSKESWFARQRMAASRSPVTRSCWAAQVRAVPTPCIALIKSSYEGLAGVGSRREVIQHPQQSLPLLFRLKLKQTYVFVGIGKPLKN